MKFSLLLSLALILHGLASAAEVPPNLRQENLAAWCIVPFDAKKRSPEERAVMLGELGITKCAYDWRPEHVAQFEEEILQYQKHGIEFFAFWGGHEKAFELFEKYDIHPQVWKMIPGSKETGQEEKVQASADLLEPLAERTAALGCKLGLYNHGGWAGEPENMVAVCEALRARGHSHVGIAYNWHHMHERLADWPEILELMKPYLHCLNLNGMNTGANPKILPLAQGEHDLALLKTLLASGYDGPIGILDHQGHTDAKLSLQDNLNGLSWLLKEIGKPGSGGKKPVTTAASAPVPAPLKETPVTPEGVESLDPAFGKALSTGMLVEAGDFRRHPPITVECRVKLDDAKGYNILVASDTKASTDHWEIFSMNGSGFLTAYIPGARPDHITTKRVITDGKWHAVAMLYETDRVRLFLDGTEVANTEISRVSKTKPVKGKLGIGGLVEGRFRLRGAIDEVRIRSGIHEDVTTVSDKPFGPVDEAEGMLWNFDDLESAGPPPLTFPRAPLNPEESPYWENEINRDRVYDFYAKEALAYGQMKPGERPDVLPGFPGLDGGEHGHWGNQNDKDTWRDGRLREMNHGSIVSGVYRGFDLVIPRAVSVKLSDGMNAVFDQETLTFRAAWKGKHVAWSDTRRGFLHGIPAGGKTKVPLEQAVTPSDQASYLGLYRNGEEVSFAYEEAGEIRYLTATTSGEKVIVTDSNQAPNAGSPQWAETVSTEIQKGDGKPYAIDTFPLPYENPWKALFFVGGLDFVSENRLVVANIHGDVWICDRAGGDRSGDKLIWKRFAAGLHQPLGVKVVDGIIHVRCRDQIVALHDSNGDDEADFYECVSDAQTTSAGGHDFITGLQRDDAGRWYFASGNEGVCRVSAEGDELEVLGTGLRNPNGLGISPDGKTVLTSVQEGNWTPASAIADVSVPGHFGAGGPREGERGYVPPMLYLPRGVDNSSGGQTYIESDRWGPVRGQWLHFSGGFAKAFLVLRETFGENGSQAAAIPLPGDFLSGAHRGRFSPFDGQLYVAGAQGWGNYGVADGSLQRVRYTGGAPYPYPVKHETRDNGLLLTFAEPVPETYAMKENWFAQQWNYRYSSAYGSPEYSANHPGREGHDWLEIRSVHRIGDGKQLFVEMPQLRPVNTLHLHFDASRNLELFATIHETGPAFTEFPGYEKIAKQDTTELRVLQKMPIPSAGIGACVACHHPTQQVVGPSFAEIRKRYAGNPDGIVEWALNPQTKTPGLPPMPSFQFMDKGDLKAIALEILGEE